MSLRVIVALINQINRCFKNVNLSRTLLIDTDNKIIHAKISYIAILKNFKHSIRKLKVKCERSLSHIYNST